MDTALRHPPLREAEASVRLRLFTVRELGVVEYEKDRPSGAQAPGVLRRCDSRFASARLVRPLTNQGLSMARNSGVAWSREPYLFMLDADNRIRPPALSRLLAAIEAAGAAFAS